MFFSYRFNYRKLEKENEKLFIKNIANNILVELFREYVKNNYNEFYFTKKLTTKTKLNNEIYLILLNCSELKNITISGITDDYYGLLKGKFNCL